MRERGREKERYLVNEHEHDAGVVVRGGSKEGESSVEIMRDVCAVEL